MAFSELETLLRKQAARAFSALCDALEDIRDLFPTDQGRTFFKAAAYEAD